MDEQQINEKIHEQVMGECWHEWRKARSSIPSTQGIICDKCGKGILWNSKEKKPKPPDYVNNISDAFLVAKKLNDKGFIFNLNIRTNGLCECNFFDLETNAAGYESARTPEKAIALAALKTLETDAEKNL